MLFIMLFSLTAGVSQSFNVTQPLPIDNNFKIGKLDNGLTYYIRKAQNPEGHAEFFIVHNVGSLQEMESQRGLAHFLEHMAFNGTKNFPDKSLLEYFGSIGVRFGYNINAYTSMDRTVYNISSVPVKLRSTIIDTALLALHDWSHYISCEQEEIDKERGVVREEWRRGDDGRTRMMKAINRVIQTGSRFAERDVIGLMDVVDNFSRETLIDYYHKWYRPDLQSVIVVGDIDIEDIEQRIKKRFSSIPKTENGAIREIYSIPENIEPIIGLNSDPESKAVSVRLVVKIPHRTVQERQTHLAAYDEITGNLLLDMFKERVQIAAKEPDAGFKVVVPVFGSVVYDCSTFTATALPKDDKNTLSAFEGLLTEVERIKQHGFDIEELETARVRILRNIEKEYKRNKDPKNEVFVSAAVEHFTRQSPLLDIDANYKLSKELLEKITLEDVNKSIDRFLSDKNRVIIFAVPESDKEYLPTEEEVLSSIDKIKSTNLEDFTPVSDKEMKKLVIETPGKIIASKKVTSKEYNIEYEKQLDSTTQWTLENGAKVIWKEEQSSDKTIKLNAFREGGYSLPIDPLDLQVLQTFLLNYSVNGLNRNDLLKWNIKTRTSVKAKLEYRYNHFSGSFIEKESENFFSLLHYFFTDVTAQKKDVKNLKTRLLKNIENPASENNKFRDSVKALKYSQSPMLSDYSKAYIENITAEKLEELYNKSFTDPAGYTFIFTGPMSAQDGKAYVEKYIASLKSEGYSPKKMVYKEPIYSKGEVSLRYLAKNMLSTKANVNRIYYGKTKYNAKNNLMAKFITYILRERYMKSIREEKGGTYFVSVKHEMVKYPSPILTYEIDFDTDPTLVDDLIEIVQLEVDKLVKDGPTEKEMKEIDLYLRKVYKDRDPKPNWSSIIENAIKKEENLSLEEKNLLNKMDAKEIRKFAKTIFKSGNRMTFIFEPEQ